MEANAELRFDLDRLVVRGPRVFGWGWIADRRRVVRSLDLIFEGDGRERRLSASVGLARKDVEQSFPRLRAAGASGFIVTGYVPNADEARVSLEVEFDDGTTTRLEASARVQRERAAQRQVVSPARILRGAWRRLRTLDFSGLLDGPGGKRFGVRSLQDPLVLAELAAGLSRASRFRVIFDHSMGGGSNAYRHDRMEEWRRQGDTVLFVTLNLPSLDYRFHLSGPGTAAREFRADSFLALEPALQGLVAEELFVNSPVSFDEPAAFAEWVARLRREGLCRRLTVAIHDYFAVCPSFVLLNDAGTFCGIPDIAECERCLGRHRAAHVAFSPPSSIGPWRESWGSGLGAADEVRCFSQASRALLLRAYPAIAAQTTLVPHQPSFVLARRPRVASGASLVIGVVGQINFQKGARLVAELVRLIERDGLDARVVVIGTLDVPIESAKLVVTGAYRREALAEIVETHGVNAFFFPSIWPETFSYVVSEMMALGLPIVAFDLGAPAERLRDYRAARLCREVSAAAALAALQATHAARLGGEAEAA